MLKICTHKYRHTGYDYSANIYVGPLKTYTCGYSYVYV